MTEDNQEKKKICFVISPIGDEGSNTRKRADNFRDYIIKPIAESLNYKVIRADEISKTGLITNQVIEYIISSDLVITDFSGLNPNVFYEVGIRHYNEKPIIHFIDINNEIPFDVSNMRIIHFDITDLANVDKAKAELKKQIVDIGDEKKMDTPVTSVLSKIGAKESKDPRQIELADMQEEIEYLKNEFRQLKLNESRNSNPSYSYDPTIDFMEQFRVGANSSMIPQNYSYQQKQQYYNREMENRQKKLFNRSMHNESMLNPVIGAYEAPDPSNITSMPVNEYDRSDPNKPYRP